MIEFMSIFLLCTNALCMNSFGLLLYILAVDCSLQTLLNNQGVLLKQDGIWVNQSKLSK